MTKRVYMSEVEGQRGRGKGWSEESVRRKRDGHGGSKGGVHGS